MTDKPRDIDATPAADSPSAQLARILETPSQRAFVAAVVLSFVALLALSFGYQVGKDAAERENRAACAAAGNLECR